MHLLHDHQTKSSQVVGVIVFVITEGNIGYIITNMGAAR